MKIKFKNQLNGKRLTLKRTRPSLKMAEVMFKVIDENRIHLEPWFPWPKQTQKIEDSLKYLFDKEEKTVQGKQLEYGLFVNLKYIGNISIFDIHRENKSAEIGYWLSSAQTRKGYMTEAVKILEKEAFENLDLNRVQIKCDEENVASCGVATKCGFTYEGTFREDDYSEYFNDFRNTSVFSKLKSEYQ
ncbi:GNAT family N-acetyltransferase [Maribacter sp. 2307UL18-2]|uniref:GNAT family N-acetyltransferase n=1 Tax=Maribacter sp. 2307UL18-2 TaxID=3386274 RepID=UPI0039BD67C9